MNDVLAISGTEQGRLVRAKQISSVELVQAHLQRVEEVNPAINAAIDVLREAALCAAQATDRRVSRGTLLGPLDGVPFSIKDSISVAGTVCSAEPVPFPWSAPTCRICCSRSKATT